MVLKGDIDVPKYFLPFQSEAVQSFPIRYGKLPNDLVDKFGNPKTFSKIFRNSNRGVSRKLSPTHSSIGGLAWLGLLLCLDSNAC
jgi:hypothetical protein